MELPEVHSSGDYDRLLSSGGRSACDWEIRLWDCLALSGPRRLSIYLLTATFFPFPGEFRTCLIFEIVWVEAIDKTNNVALNLQFLD